MDNVKVIVSYLVEDAFRDKYTKEDITPNTVLEISVERMKELNQKKKGRAIDVKVVTGEATANVANFPTPGAEDTEVKNPGEPEPKEGAGLTREELELLTVVQLKELAEKKNIELKSAKKSEIIEELLKG